MKLKDRLSYALPVLRYRLLKHRVPAVVSWAITYRCNQQCLYCQWPRVKSNELTGSEAMEAAAKLVRLKTRRVNFTGGEPLLRDDLGSLIDYFKKQQIFVCLNSNGSLVEKKIGSLTNLSLLNLSLEGPRQIHDKLRGAGTYKAVIAAAETAKACGLRFKFTATFNRVNSGSTDFLIKLAHKFKTGITFQIAEAHVLGTGAKNAFSLGPKEIKDAFSLVLSYKNDPEFKKTVLMPKSLLKYLCQWPDIRPLECAAGKVLFRLSPDGKLFPCARATFEPPFIEVPGIDLRGNDIIKIKQLLASQVGVPGGDCFCACTNRLQANLLFNWGRRI